MQCITIYDENFSTTTCRSTLNDVSVYGFSFLIFLLACLIALTFFKK